MIEVESKFSVENAKIIREEIKKIEKFERIDLKVDDYYTLEDLNQRPQKSLRIRKINGFYIANFKHRLSYKNGVYAKKEVEFVIDNIESFLGLIKDFGFRKWLRKEKRCEIYGIKKNFQIELNHVKGLGWFIEIEYLVDSESKIEKARREVVKVMKELGFDENDAVKEGYTRMLWDKMH